MARLYACSAITEVATVLDANCGCVITDEDTEVVERAIDAASDILCVLSGFRVTGLCVKTLRPIVPSLGACFPAPHPLWNHRYDRDDLRTAGAERFGGLMTIPLPGPFTNVLEVVIDGIAIDESEYGLLEGNMLYRKAGEWPIVNDLRLDGSADEGTFQITVRFGSEPDFIGESAGVELACELTKTWLGQQSSLPHGITSANIQGAAVQVDREARDKPSTLPAVTRFLSVYAPNGRNVSGVWSPELSQGWELVEVSEA